MLLQLLVCIMLLLSLCLALELLPLAIVQISLLLLRFIHRMKLLFVNVSSLLGKSLTLSLWLNFLVVLLIKPHKLPAISLLLIWLVSFLSLAFLLPLLSSAILVNFDSRGISGPQYLLDVLGPTDKVGTPTCSSGPQAVKVAPPAPSLFSWVLDYCRKMWYSLFAATAVVI